MQHIQAVRSFRRSRGLFLTVVFASSTAFTSCIVYDNGDIIFENNYFKERTNVATRDLVGKRYGVPLKREHTPDGGEIWLYEERIHRKFLNVVTTTCRTHWLTFGADGILKKSETDDWCKDTLTR